MRDWLFSIMFVDRVTIDVQAGRGGNGCVSFRREKYVPRGGPNGGDGGNGGSVVIRAQSGVNSLSALAHRKRWRAESGQRGQGSDCHGRSGQDLLILVPPGTVIIDAEEGFVLKDLMHENDELVAARGGKGGWGNTHFKSSVNRAPREHTPGEEGEQRRLHLELKVIADVGLIGKPNAGKSTMLSRLTRARPEIAAYPFTTKQPNLGEVRVSSDRAFIMADIPGLIEGAHAGVGLGHEFLRHIERSGVLIHLVEPCPQDGTDPLQNYLTIRDELTRYNEELGQRPEVVVITKSELPGAQEVRDQLAEKLGREVLLVSAVTGSGLNDLVRRIVQRLDTGRPHEPIADRR
jgi:GTPase